MCGRLGHLRSNLIGGDTGAYERGDLNLRQKLKKTSQIVHDWSTVQAWRVFVSWPRWDISSFAGV